MGTPTTHSQDHDLVSKHSFSLSPSLLSHAAYVRSRFLTAQSIENNPHTPHRPQHRLHPRKASALPKPATTSLSAHLRNVGTVA